MTVCVLITGGASGLGAALVKRYAQQGAKICIADLPANTHANRAKSVIAQHSPQAADLFFQPCDITNQADVEELLKVITARWGKLDILVNNAGVATGGALAFEDIEQWEWVLNINLLGMVRMSRAFVPIMAKQPQSYLINIASQAGITPIPYMASYNASKAAVVSFSETMHLELARDGINVSVVCPSFFATNLDESMRSKQPGVHELVKKLLSRSDLNADEVADIIVNKSKAGDFMILSHKIGIKAWWMKRFMPTNRYMRMMKKKLQRFGPK